MKTALLSLAGAATALVAIPALHAQGSNDTPGQMEVSRVQAGTYALDPAHTLVQWSVDHFGFNDYFGLFGDIEGTMQLDPANIEATTFDISVPIDQVTVASEGLRDHLLRPGEDGGDPDFFGPEPGMAQFTSTNVRRLDETSAIVTGQLAMNGQTNPVTMRVEFTGAGANPMSEAETVGFRGTAAIKRSEWGIDYGIPMVGDQVDLTITAAFERQ